MTRGERVCAKLLLTIVMQVSFLMRAASQTGVPEDCATGIYYTAIPESIFPVCHPFLQPLSMLCSVKVHSNQASMIDMNWFYTAEGVPVSSGEQCPLLEGDTGTELLNSTRHTVIKHWDHAEQTLSVTLTISPLQEQDIGRYWCQATLPGVTLGRTAAYCQRDAAQTSFIPFSCRTLSEESNVCVTKIPQATPTMLISSIPAQSSLSSQISNSSSIVSETKSPSPSPSISLPTQISNSFSIVSVLTKTKSPSPSPSISALSTLSSQISNSPSIVSVLTKTESPSPSPSISAQSSLSTQILNSPSIASVLTKRSPSPSPSVTSISHFSRSSFFESFTIVSSTHSQVASSNIMMSSSSSHNSQSPTSTEPVSGEYSSNDVLVMSIVFCTLSAVILLVTVIIALSVIRCRQRMHHWIPEPHITNETGQSTRQMDSQSPQPVIPKTVDSTSSDGHTRFQIHQAPQNPLHSTLQNMSINLGPVGPSSMSVGSDIYSEIGPPLPDSSLSHHEIQRTSPPIPPRPFSSRQENPYDIPETDDARSITSHTYTLPADARERATITSTSRNTTIEHHTASTGDSWFGRRSPILVFQQSYTTQDDILDGKPVGVSRESIMSWRSQASSELQETDTENDDESGVRAESITHEAIEAYLPPDDSWVMVHQPLARVQPTTSVSPQLPFGFTEDMQDTAEVRPGCATESTPSSFAQPNRLLVSNTGKSSPSPSTSSGCTDLSKYSGDYERDPLYMEQLLQQQRAPMVGTNNELLSSAESAIYSPLSPVSPSPPQTSREHHYTPLDCYRLEPIPAYSRLQRHSIETTV